MSFTTAQYHCPSELEFVNADDLHNEVTFRSASYSQPGGYHTTTLNVLTGERTCSCFGAKRSECWHQTLIAAAWDGHAARSQARRYTASQLLKAGAKARNMVEVYRARCWSTLPADRVAVVACRQEWRERAALAHSPERIAA